MEEIREEIEIIRHHFVKIYGGAAFRFIKRYKTDFCVYCYNQLCGWTEFEHTCPEYEQIFDRKTDAIWMGLDHTINRVTFLNTVERDEKISKTAICRLFRFFPTMETFFYDPQTLAAIGQRIKQLCL